MKLTDEINMLRKQDDTTGLKQNSLIDKFLELIERHKDKLVELPVAIGQKAYIPFKFREFDDSVTLGIDEVTITGYIDESGKGGKQWLTYTDGAGASSDVEIDSGLLFDTKQEAEKVLKIMPVDELGGI